MTHHVRNPRTERSAALALLAALGLLAAMLVATPNAAAGAVEGGPTIMEIQGDGHLSPLVGETVTTAGVVTAVGFRSFYLQDTAGDGDDTTSDGILVSSTSAVAVGDIAYVTGVVEENIGGGPATGNLSVTRIVGDATVMSSGNALPTPVEIGRYGRDPSLDVVISESELPTNLQTDAAVSNIDVDAIDFYESLEGMYVEVDRPIASSATRQFNGFSSEFFVIPSLQRSVQPRSARTGRGGILLGADPDNNGDQNPERINIQIDGTIFPAAVPQVDVGDLLSDVRGVVGYSFGNFEVNATETFTMVPKNLRDERTALTRRTNEVTVASYNVLNLSPGAVDDAQRAKIASQIVRNLKTPDVIALQEIQDNSGVLDDGVTAADQTIQALIDAIVDAGGPTYVGFDVAPADGASGGIPGGNIRNAFLYNPDRVELQEYRSVTPEVLAAQGASNPDAFAGTRDPLAAAFTFNGTPFVVISNHLTSRFGSSPIFGGPQPFVQAGEAEREAQVLALNELVQAATAFDPELPVMVVGDLNTFEWTNDLAEILPGDGLLTNLLTTNALASNDRRNLYTFIFDGNSQALDHFFVTENLVTSRTKIDIVHANVDFSRTFADVTASDHEPLVARFRLPERVNPQPQPSSDFKLQVLHASDLEGGVEALDRAANFAAIVDALEENDSVDASLTLSAGDNYIPGPFFAASSDGSMRDVFQSVYSDLFDAELTNVREAGGRADISIMNIIGFDASALGNHEFDAGTDVLASIIGQDVRGDTLGDIRWPGAQFPYLSSNLDFSADGSLSGLFTPDILPNTDFAAGLTELLAGATPPKIAPATVIDVGDGEKVGVVGATTQLLDIISSPGATDVIGPNVNDMAQVATLIQPQIDAMEAMGINKIIVVSHFQQLALEVELSSILDGADIMIAGGSDSLLANDDDALRAGDEADETYPVLSTDAAGDPVVIVSTDGQYSYVGQLNVVFNGLGQLVAPDRSLVDSLDDLDLTMNGPVKTEDAEVAALWGSTDAAVAEGTKANLVKRLVDAVEAVVIAKDGNVLGESSVYLDGRRASVRTEETNFGNLGADANLAAARDFDDSAVFSLKNGGGIRAPIGEVDIDGNFLPPQANPLSGKLDGEISQLDVENSLRFNNGLSLLSLTGTEMQAMIEHAVAGVAPGATPGQFAQIGGGSFSYDPTADVGSRVIDFSVLDSTGNALEPVIVDGAVVSPGKVYRIVTLNFLAGGGDGYPFNTLSAADRVDLVGLLTEDGGSTFADPGSEQDALAEFLIDNHGIGAGTPFDQAETDPADDTRIVDVTIGS